MYGVEIKYLVSFFVSKKYNPACYQEKKIEHQENLIFFNELVQLVLALAGKSLLVRLW